MSLKKILTTLVEFANVRNHSEYNQIIVTKFHEYVPYQKMVSEGNAGTWQYKKIEQQQVIDQTLFYTVKKTKKCFSLITSENDRNGKFTK